MLNNTYLFSGDGSAVEVVFAFVGKVNDIHLAFR